jgi:acyl-CoA thioester hydrolase
MVQTRASKPASRRHARFRARCANRNRESYRLDPENRRLTRPFVVREYVRWGDVDPMGIIRYDAYTRFFELAESELFRSIGAPHRALMERFGITIPRRVMHMDFISAPVLDEQLEVRAYVSAVGTTSLTLNFDIYGEGAVLRCTGHLVLVCVTAGATQITTRPWPDAFLRLLEPYRLTVQDARSPQV